MLRDLYVSRTGKKYVQKIAQCTILPQGEPGVCYQELDGEYRVYTISAAEFEMAYAKLQMAEPQESVPERRREVNEKVVEKATEKAAEKVALPQDGMTGLLRFLDADTYREKMQILEEMKGELDDHLLNNMAVSLDLSLEDGKDGYEFIMSELKIRSRFEGKRGERL